MSRQLFDLESVLQQLIVEHRKLLRHLEAQQNAMKSFALDQMDSAANQQEASRLRIASLEARRRMIVQEIAKQNRLAGELSLARLATLFPQRGDSLLKARDELKKVIGEIQTRSHVAGRLAGAVLGHLNTVVRLLAGAVERAGIYTKQGVPRVSTRIGVMEAVG
jgi:flagellar FlgN protein